MDYTGNGVWGSFDYPKGVMEDAQAAAEAGVDRNALINAYGGYILRNLGVSDEVVLGVNLDERVLGMELNEEAA